ncbi:MAG TPA: PAS domain S-box protein [Longimicrobiales bacterium]|nr:PAS domain S-box protein [Longimicrobiales bacterium]
MTTEEGDPRQAGLLRVLILSLLAAAIPVAGAFLFPATLQDYEALTWLVLLVPAFLWADARGWRGIATALALGMAAVTVTYVLTQLIGSTVPDLLLPVIVAYVAITLGIGLFGARVARGGFDAAADMRALNDEATGLPNRTQADLHLELEFAAAQKGRPLTIVLFDIDDLAQYNARHGRTAGDAVLRGFASLVRQHTRRMDLGARHGDDEFISVLGGCVTEGAVIFTTRLLERMRAAESTHAVPTVSAGIASFDPEMTAPADLLHAAEAALQLAKREGGDRFRVHAAPTTAGVDVGEDPTSANGGSSASSGTPSALTAPGATPDADPAETPRTADVLPPIHLDASTKKASAGRGRTAFLLTADPNARTRLTTFLREQGFQLIEGTALLDAFATLRNDFDLVFVDVAPRAPAVADLVREIRTHSPTTRVIGIPRTDRGALAPETLNIRVDAHYIPTTDVTALQRQTVELLAERDALQASLLRHRQLSDEIRAKDRESRAAIEASEARYRSVVDTIQEVIFTTDGNGALTFLNPAWTAVTGYGVDECMGRSVYQFMHPDDRDALLAQLAVALETGDAQLRHEGRWTARDGETRWIEMRLQLDVGAAGLLGTSGVLADATERRLAEDALRESEEYFRSLIENSSDMMAVMNRDGTVRYVSPAVGRVLGTPPSEWIGTNVFTTGSQEHDARQREVFEEVVAAPGSTRTTQARARHADGELRHLEITWRNLLQVPGVEGVVVNARDVTERHESERALRQSEELLLRAQKMEAIGRLAGGVAHDFNNLLTAIQGHADLLLSDLRENDAIRPDLQEIRDAADRATSLTRQLLAFSRRQVLQPRVIEANSVVSHMERMLRRLIGENILLTTELSDEAGCVRADPTQIEQVLLNLVVNARDAMPDGGRVMITSARRTFGRSHRLPAELAAGEYVVLTVQDTGGGMPSSVAARAFEPFFTTKPAGQGTGLGLSTAYGIVKQSGGHVWLNSTPGTGTEVTVLLPRVDEEADVAAPHVLPASTDHRGSETILLVEDEKSVRDLARRILERRGYNVIAASDGGEAIELVEREEQPIHLLLTDVIMPGLNGQDVALRVRALRPDIRVLFMSGYNEEAVLRHGVLAAGAAFIEKPFSPPVLLERVRGILSEANQPEANQPEANQPDAAPTLQNGPAAHSGELGGNPVRRLDADIA